MRLGVAQFYRISQLCLGPADSGVLIPWHSAPHLIGAPEIDANAQFPPEALLEPSYVQPWKSLWWVKLTFISLTFVAYEAIPRRPWPASPDLPYFTLFTRLLSTKLLKSFTVSQAGFCTSCFHLSCLPTPFPFIALTLSSNSSFSSRKPSLIP